MSLTQENLSGIQGCSNFHLLTLQKKIQFPKSRNAETPDLPEHKQKRLLKEWPAGPGRCQRQCCDSPVDIWAANLSAAEAAAAAAEYLVSGWRPPLLQGKVGRPVLTRRDGSLCSYLSSLHSHLQSFCHVWAQEWKTRSTPPQTAFVFHSFHSVFVFVRGGL